MNALLELARALCDEAGLEPSVVPDVHLRAALKRRQLICGAPTLEDYAARCAARPEERGEILEEVLVRESWFFRDQAPYELLTALASTRWCNQDSPLRALSAPCANGEEAYSIAIALAEAGHSLSRLQVCALDLSQRGLKAAAAGRYEARALGQLPAPLRQRWLIPTATGHYLVHAALRACVQYQHANLLALPAALTAQRYQVLCCRNAMIYLRPAVRRRLLEQWMSCLAGDGVLIVGHAEAALMPSRWLRPVGPPGAFAFEHAPVAIAPVVRATATRRSGAPQARSAHPASRPPPQEPTRRPVAPAPLAEAAALADRGRYAPAAALLEQLLASDYDQVEALYLLGLVRAAEGDVAAARRCFTRALYLVPAHQASLEHLALLAADGEDSAAARRLRRRSAHAAAPE